MLKVSVWRSMFGVDDATVIESIEVDDAGEGENDEPVLVASVRPRRPGKWRCGRCGARSPRYDRNEGRRRRWRAPDLGLMRCYLEAQVPRVRCTEHGVVVAQVPWARHDARHTRAFDDIVAWMAVAMSKTAITTLMRVAWATVGSIIDRVVGEARAHQDPFDGLVRIGIDEISYKKGHRYLTIVVDHDTGRLVWAAPGRDKATLSKFFDQLGDQRASNIRLVSADAADWIATVVAERCKNATICMDAFHVVGWATDALDEVRREVWNEARDAGMTTHARELKGCRYALWRNPEDLTALQKVKLSWIAKINGRLYRAYLMKEQLRMALRIKGPIGHGLLEAWCEWAQRCRIPAFVELGRKIRRHWEAITATLEHGLSNGLVESTNTKIRVLTRVAYGFREPEHLIALALLDRGGYRPDLPGRSP